MNVKLGDAAIVIKGRCSNIGKIVYVAHETPDRDYSFMGYGILPSWFVESLGGDLDTDSGPSQSGFTPDISLLRLDLTRKQAKAMRNARIDRNIQVALNELAGVLHDYTDKPEKKLVRNRERQRSTIPTQKTFATSEDDR